MAIQNDGAVLISDIIRSRIDPNGIFYATVTLEDASPGFWIKTIHALRPVPLAPVWLEVGLDAGDGVGLDAGDGWQFTVQPGERVEIPLTLDARYLGPGTYRDTLLVRPADGSTPALVPVALTVEPPIATQAGAVTRAASLSAPFPNPVREQARLALTVAEAAHVEAVVYDVLGRRMTVLHEGALPPGEHSLELDASRLSAGVYVVRVNSEMFSLSRRITVVR